ncbi:MAG TPA: hypothetical protein VK177_07240 [Flavobacteriales bacterium]|nr:hypothetical protein [Flavobacteriales bacterium]
MKRISIYSLLFLGCFAMENSAFAQTQNTEIEVSESARRKVEKAVKIADKPQYKDSVMSPIAVKYSGVSAQANTSIAPEPLKAANVIPKEMLDKLYRFYVKGGFGTYTSILGEAYYNSERHATNDFGIHYKHFSSLGGINDFAFNGFSTNEANVYGSKIFKSYRLNAEAKYKRDAFHYYGFNPDSIDLDKSTTQQVYNGLLFRLSGNTTYANDTSKITHQEILQYRPYFDNRGAFDHNIMLDLSGGKKYGKEYYALGFMVDYNQMNDDSCDCLKAFKEPQTYTCYQQQYNMIMGLNPTVTTYTGKLKIKVGLLVNADIYDKGKFYFFPDLDFSYSLFNDMFVPYAGTNRSIVRNSLYTITQQNPFIVTNTEYINQNQKLNVYGGIRGTWSANLSFNSKLSYSRNENVALFVEDTLFSYENRFRILYENLDVLTADAHILYRASTKWHVLFGGTYYKYSTNTEQFAWNLPEFRVYSTLNYNLKDKIVIRYNLEVLGKRYGYSLTPLSGVTMQPDGKYIYELKPYIDTDIQLEYRYTKRFSVFANFNNLAGRYQRWRNYPVQSFNAVGGVTYMF